MRITGVEPAPPCEDQHLKLARLPIPPYPQILNLSGSRARVTLAVDVIFLRLGAPKKIRPMRLCPARCICRGQRSRANCLFRHIRKLSFCPLNFTRRGLPRRSISLNPLDYYIINPVKVNIYFFVLAFSPTKFVKQ